jgi:hypothetical protein
LYNAELTELGFGIFYMYPYNRTFVQFNYTLMLPSLKTPAITFNANWYGNPMGEDEDLEDAFLPQQQYALDSLSELKKHSGRPPVGKSAFTWSALSFNNDGEDSTIINE